jgi:hypothetical protein
MSAAFAATKEKAAEIGGGSGRLGGDVGET